LWSGSKASNIGNQGKSWEAVPAEAEAKNPLPDNQTAIHAVQHIEKLSVEYEDNGGEEGVKSGATRPFFLAVGFHKPHLPFVASAQYFDYYSPSVVKLPDDNQPPHGMPPVAWSNGGELLNYQDQPKNATGAPGTDLPDADVLDLRRAYYASVTQTDDMLGKVCVRT
jgi:iduronate 2-sulfatase